MNYSNKSKRISGTTDIGVMMEAWEREMRRRQNRIAIRDTIVVVVFASLITLLIILFFEI